MAAVKISERCAVKGCKKRMAEDTDLCKHHFALAVARRREAHKTETAVVIRTPPPVLTALCAAVAAKYRADGDVTKAGVVVACLQHDPPRFYASVARYPSGPLHKEVVCQVGKWSMLEQYATAEDAVAALANRWADDNRPAPVKETIDNLDSVLRQL